MEAGHVCPRALIGCPSNNGKTEEKSGAGGQILSLATLWLAVLEHGYGLEVHELFSTFMKVVRLFNIIRQMNLLASNEILYNVLLALMCLGLNAADVVRNRG